ncbi:hypothetical protein HPB52_023236 [Rhipicephalus sanguineus]|uniref:Uncharacterized protein n=1 Tax=Rhipicephalus sanguineus TaxID=34632 RepID=A0A9D4PY45_RHISA|nr:hypothetical protein HPB52_023236 [Rhipicephalus sanguineus]
MDIHEEMKHHMPGFIMCSVPEISIKGKEVQARAVLLNTQLKKLCVGLGVKFISLSKTLEEEGDLARDGIHFRAETVGEWQISWQSMRDLFYLQGGGHEGEKAGATAGRNVSRRKRRLSAARNLQGSPGKCLPY